MDTFLHVKFRRYTYTWKYTYMCYATCVLQADEEHLAVPSADPLQGMDQGDIIDLTVCAPSHAYFRYTDNFSILYVRYYKLNMFW